MADKPQAAATGLKRLQFIASVRKAARRFDEGRSPIECLSDIQQALKVLDRSKKR
ncbi:hypothetical protein [Mycoplana rhizolycopersici]|uniref:Uncharacterized protein n=1 Tax=Mycoplana rhizolycopersici TaxID=2746702 RepID=A0ABX2QJC3_9HYPH|nr:hypothetical protein [Rhizobium rhizolycopersici]NVP57891.1 hypothetical protein [Rhizobium rhizolycopersici]